jgi:hypothetical protein
MLYQLEGKVSMRKMRLFAIACCQRVEHILIQEDEWGRDAIHLAERLMKERVDVGEVAETRDKAWHAGYRLIDGFREEEDLNARYHAIFATFHALQEGADSIYYSPPRTDLLEPRSDFREVASHARSAVRLATRAASPWLSAEQAEIEEQRHQIAIARDIFGCPFRTVHIDPTGLAHERGAVPWLAEGIYNDLAFQRMPKLAELLANAGCTNADILNHCNHPGEHVRGCWVIDLLLGKA